MRAPLRLAVAQPVCVAGDVAANAMAHAQAIEAAAARVVAFPELSLTGYVLDAAAVAPDDAALGVIVDACAAWGAVALVGAPVRSGDEEHVATLRVEATGVAVAYRKAWPGGDEPARFSPGPGPATTDVDGWRIGLGVCRDTGVAEHLEGTVALGLDAYVAGLVHHPHELGEHEARALRIARRAGVPVAFASAAGPAGGPYDPGAGHSAIWGADGAVLARAGAAPGELARATLG